MLRNTQIRMSNKKLFWVRMHDLQEGIVVKNMSDIVRKEIPGIFRTKNPTKDQIQGLQLSFYW